MNHALTAARHALATQLAAYPGQAPLRLALSGGLDSCLLLHLLAAEPDWRDRLQAIHVHHGLSAHADQWLAFCRERCAGLGVTFVAERVQLSPGNGESLEAQARTARYQALAKHLPPDGLLLTAHHGDDQLETLLLALKRGSGVRGLGAMRPSQPFAGGQLLRPWLALAREQLLEAAQALGIDWVEDESNQDDRFDRNFLRLHLLPLLRERWPAMVTTAARSAELCAESSDLLDELAEQDAAGVMVSGQLLIAPLEQLNAPRRANVIRFWLRSLGAATLSREQLQRLWQEVALARTDAEPQFCWEQWCARRYQGRLVVLPQAALHMPAPDWQGMLNGDNWLTLPAGLGRLRVLPNPQGALRAPRSGERLSIRFSVEDGSRLHPVGRAGSRRLKKLWQEYAIAPWLRGSIPILYYNETPAAVLGVFVCAGFAAEADEARLGWQWQRA